jgi:hypothetical protein
MPFQWLFLEIYHEFTDAFAKQEMKYGDFYPKFMAIIEKQQMGISGICLEFLTAFAKQQMESTISSAVLQKQPEIQGKIPRNRLQP